MVELRLLLRAEPETREFAAELARLCGVGDCVLLHGEVGAGKTAFARGFISAIAEAAGEIVSPTFTLVQLYDLPSEGKLYHCDLYRLKSAAEIVELGLEEAFDSGIILVEWPEIAEGFFQENSLKIFLSIKGEGREILLRGNDEVWADRFKKLEMWKKI